MNYSNCITVAVSIRQDVFISKYKLGKLSIKHNAVYVFLAVKKGAESPGPQTQHGDKDLMQLSQV